MLGMYSDEVLACDRIWGMENNVGHPHYGLRGVHKLRLELCTVRLKYLPEDARPSHPV